MSPRASMQGDGNSDNVKQEGDDFKSQMPVEKLLRCFVCGARL